MDIVFASNNSHKIEEIRDLAGKLYNILSLKDVGIDIDIPEPHQTLEANASEKSWTIYKLTGHNCFSDDTGLEVAALGGEPGVKSARYAGEETSFDKNIEKLLMKLDTHNNRSARFRAVVSLIMNGKEYLFEGVCNGTISKSPRGKGGFGYDPIFIPDGENRTFAEMSLTEKASLSHRGMAMAKLVAFLQKLQIKTQN